MKPLPYQTLPCKCGCDYIRDTNGSILYRSKESWLYYGKQLAKQKSKADNFKWNEMLTFIPAFISMSNEYFRLSFAAQPE